MAVSLLGVAVSDHFNQSLNVPSVLTILISARIIAVPRATMALESVVSVSGVAVE